ncbi:MAG TPA: stage II sporulation protein M [Gemmatimonadaceae bacterium]|nr:stage II sporulation protein M [Gemmatimonadaceae bacterium]
MTVPRHRPPPVGHLEQRVEVETPELVAFSYTIAGAGSRAAAVAIDYLIITGLTAGLGVLGTILSSQLRAGRAAGPDAGSWVSLLIILGWFSLNWGYFVVWEAVADGQTPGKRVMGLRVVQDGGYSVGVGASAVRNLVRVLDMQPGFLYGVGLVSAALSPNGKRLGDHLAGTVVVQERAVELAPATVARPADASAGPPPASRLDDEEYAVLERWMARRGGLEPARRSAFAAELARHFGGRVDDLPGEPAARLARLFELERAARARGVAARHDTGAAREQHAIVAGRAAHWAAFARALDAVAERGLRRVPEEELGEFVARYREAATDLARLKTAARGRDSDALFYLSRLVARGHNLIYRRREIALRAAGRHLAVTVPAEVRRAWRPILLAALLFYGPAAATYVAVRQDPSITRDLLSGEMIDRAESAASRARMGEGYLTIPESFRPVLVGLLIQNNVRVVIGAFAFGLTGGVLTVVMLVLNGVMLGAPFAVFHNEGAPLVLLDWVLAHGVLELSAICIGGGGGLLIASGILLPGALTRREAIVVQGRRALRLLTAAVLFLLGAGVIEGLISPRPWPLEWKGAVAVASALAIAFYVTRGRGATEDPTPLDAYSEARALISR